VVNLKEQKSVYVRSFGCSANTSDGEVIAGCLKAAGYKVVSDPSDAEILVYNTCAVKAPTENRMISLLGKVSPEKKLIVAGCLPLINLPRLRKEVSFNGAIGPSPGLGIIDLIKRVERGETVTVLNNYVTPNLSLPRLTSAGVKRILPISYGCVSSCSFCVVRYARGRLRSHTIEDIKHQVRQALNDGASEIWLTGQDVSCYGWDIGTSLPALVKETASCGTKFFIRIGMMNPQNVLKILDDLVEIYRINNVFKFLHLPVQSGDDEVLKVMNRRYSIEEFKRIILKVRREIPWLTLATDIICGFPNESDQAFQNSMKLIEEVKPDIVNISRFCSRPKTPAGNMKQIQSLIAKERTRQMAELTRKISHEKNLGWVGWKGEIIIDEIGKANSWVGRNFAYKPIALKRNDNALGRYLDVEVKKAYPTYLEGEVL